MDNFSKSDIDKSFGKLIKDYRLAKNMTQDELAEALNISEKYISRIENGYSGVKRQTLINCMNVLGIPPNLIFKDFITDKNLLLEINISEKLNKLSPKKLAFANGMLDLLLSDEADD